MTGKHFLDKELRSITSLTNKGDVLNKNVSMATVSWHLQHSLMVINKICEAIQASDPKKFKGKFNLKRSIVFSLNKIPRGKGKSPKQVRPDENISKLSIEKHMTEAHKNLITLETLHKNAYFQHPFFGDLNLKNTKRFLRLHTRHHLKIIEDILNN
jgi:hypothetical protein